MNWEGDGGGEGRAWKHEDLKQLLQVPTDTHFFYIFASLSDGTPLLRIWKACACYFLGDTHVVFSHKMRSAFGLTCIIQVRIGADDT